MTARKPSAIRLAGADIALPKAAPDTLRFAAGELARYLFLLSGRVSRVANAATQRRPVIRLLAGGSPAAGRETADEQAYSLKAFHRGGTRGIEISGGSPVGVLYGVYGLLEKLGMGFYAGGDTFPDDASKSRCEVPGDLDMAVRPSFAVRGDMLHYNFLCGCTTWGLNDWKFYFDQLARARQNLLLMHWYDDEPGGAYEVGGEYLAGGRANSSLSRPWGATDSLRTSQFSFGTGAWFDEEIFGSPEGETSPDPLAEIRAFERSFSEAVRYARRAGVRVAAGFEEPRGFPTDTAVADHFRERVRQFLQRNPHLACFALWNHESGGSVGTPLPPPDSDAWRLYETFRDAFAYLGHRDRVWEAIRFMGFARIAYETIAETAPNVRLVLVGWGGDRWMQFADYCLGYDKLLPKDIVFTCHDNIDASIGSNVSTPWGELPGDRERWAMPWVEGDLNECWSRQPNVEALGLLAPDAFRKGCQGLLTLHWRTRDCEEESGFAARFAWDPTLTPEGFYHLLASHAFGPDQADAMGRVLGRLQKLGARWTGVSGTPECSTMRWTGWEPHIPFRIDGAAALHLREFALKARDALAEVPESELQDHEAGMFHMRESGETSASGPALDYSRPGCSEYEDVAECLLEVSRETSPETIRRVMRACEEKIYRLRPRLIHFGIPVKCHSPVDVFLIRCHHLTRHGDVAPHFEALDEIRTLLTRLRSRYERAGRAARLERLDYLIATLDFVTHYDRAAMLLAEGEMVETAVHRASEARDAGDARLADQIAAEAYNRLVAAGMRSALLAQCRKLTTRCDFGVLCTLNVKPMPLYWQTVERLEAMLWAAPPRDLSARAHAGGIDLAWSRPARAAGFHLHRRPVGESEFTRITRQPLAARTHLFTDRPPSPGRYEYAVQTTDEHGEGGPLSHPADAAFGSAAGAPRIVASKPPTTVEAGTELPVRVVVCGDRETRSVTVHYTQPGVKGWRQTPMLRRFRNSWHTVLPADAAREGTLLYYVEAVDTEGARSLWPSTAESGLPWSATVVAAVSV